MAFFNWILRLVENSHSYKHLVPKQIDKLMSKYVSEISQSNCKVPVINNPSVETILDSSFNNVFGGVHLLVAPSGSGKSTYLRSYANRFIKNGGRVQLFSSELQSSKQFYNEFGDEKRSMDLFEMLPKKSAIIFDQIEVDGKLSGDLKSLFKHMAFESRRVSGVSVIISTASLNLAKEILYLNGNDKFRINGAVKDWRWTPDLIDSYMAQAVVFQNLSESKRDMVKICAYKASCPAFLYTCADLLDGNPDTDIEILAKRADKFAQVWEEFEKTDFY